MTFIRCLSHAGERGYSLLGDDGNTVLNKLKPERNHDDSGGLSSTARSRFQNQLSAPCLPVLARGIVEYEQSTDAPPG